MSKRTVTYTSSAISITHHHFITGIKQYVMEKFGIRLTNQQVLDAAVELLWQQKDEIQKILPNSVVPNPDVEAFLALRAKLLASGSLPEGL